MSRGNNVFVAGIVLAVLTAYVMLNEQKHEVYVPEETSWRPGEGDANDVSIRNFKVVFPEKVVADLKNRLNNTRALTPSLKGVGWHYGTGDTAMANVVDYWLNKYDFKKREQFLNKYPQFVTKIQGLDIHFIHVKPSNPSGKKVLPLLLLHGWPGSVVEFYKIIPLLTTPRPEYDFVFEVVAPSLPGFGFSSPATVPGLGMREMGLVLKNLMLRLGKEKFYLQGGDWGAVISAEMSAMFPDNVLGIHSNMCVVLTPYTIAKILLYGVWPNLFMSNEEAELLYPFGKQVAFLIENSGYFHIQATKPDTIGVAMNDSPAGLAAYILEKFSGGTNRAYADREDGGLVEMFTMDELLDNLMLYWVPKTSTTSFRIYAESFRKESFAHSRKGYPIEVPSACVQFPHEIFYQPAVILKDRYKNLIRVTRMPSGGHFAALENPLALSEDIFQSIAEMEALSKRAGST